MMANPIVVILYIWRREAMKTAGQLEALNP